MTLAPLRVAILADTHGFLDPRIADEVAGCDYAVHAGDVGSADVLLALKPRLQVIAVRGNNDVPEKWDSNEVPLLATLPREATLELPGGRLAVVHGDDVAPAAERHAQLRQRYPEARAIAYGHSHQLEIDDHETPWILNPGAAGRVRTHGGPACLVLECRHEGWSLEALRFPPRKYRAL